MESARWRPTPFRVALVVVGGLVLTVVLGGVTEAVVGNWLAQEVRKAIVIGMPLGILGWIAAYRRIDRERG